MDPFRNTKIKVENETIVTFVDHNGTITEVDGVWDRMSNPNISFELHSKI